MMGRLTRDPEIRYSQGSNMAVARYSIAVDRKFKKSGEPETDFFNCVAFGKVGEFAEKYLHKGTKIIVTGRLQTGSYTNKDGQKVNTIDIVVEEHDFAESRSSANNNGGYNNDSFNSSGSGFMNIPAENEDELPFM